MRISPAICSNNDIGTGFNENFVNSCSNIRFATRFDAFILRKMF